MAKRERQSDRKVINKRLKQGRGQGRGADYLPYLRVQDVPSQGLVTRVGGWKTGREHHFLSCLECDYFYLLEWSPLVVDIREQYPLDLDETLAIGADLGIRHPTDPRTREPVVMTTDFVNTVRRNIGTIEHARTLKYATDLARPRVMEKFEIERVYWSSRDIDWGIVTEREIDPVLATNIRWLHPYRDAVALAPLTAAAIGKVEATLTPRVVTENLPLRDLTDDCDRQFNLPPGTSLAVARHLLASGRWQVNMRSPIQVPQRLNLIGVAVESTSLREAG
ncbi:MAG: TnsA endonuclease N-terminal domain-containing protein [Pyrinomonadaceae bacterium MAG19_C2-C3]|nr:TnsA endonuclease N-terminal domain-containing protein [Pyrinomonadaceae bacterium MAG19_C2-C3]